MKRKPNKKNKLACVLSYEGKTRKCFARDWDHLKQRAPDAVRRTWYLWCNVNLENLHPVSNNEWHGVVYSVCGKSIKVQVIDREDRVKEAARLLGAIGGSSGTGKKKVRGDSNYYRVLRYKGIEKQRKKNANKDIK